MRQTYFLITDVFQETMKELFPSRQAVRRYREVVLFVVGLMKDPRPLVQHVYEMWVEDYLYAMRTIGHIPLIDFGLFKSLHAESTVPLPHPLHNQYINYYNHDSRYGGDPSDRRPVYWPSRLYEFKYMKHKVELDHHTEGEEIPPCTMWIWNPHEAVMDSLLSICSEIFKYQAVTDLDMMGVTCNSLEVLRLINLVMVRLSDCKFPDDFVENLLRELKGCGESLQELKLKEMNLAPFESLLDELLEDLVAHHQRKPSLWQRLTRQRKREAGLAQKKLKLMLTGDKDKPINLSEEFVEKWKKRCKKVDSIYCWIGDD